MHVRRESPGNKELKRVNLNILPNSAFGCPTRDLHGFSSIIRERRCTLTDLASVEDRGSVGSNSSVIEDR
jgi:hypothetical protein